MQFESGPGRALVARPLGFCSPPDRSVIRIAMQFKLRHLVCRLEGKKSFLRLLFYERNRRWAIGGFRSAAARKRKESVPFHLRDWMGRDFVCTRDESIRNWSCDNFWSQIADQLFYSITRSGVPRTYYFEFEIGGKRQFWFGECNPQRHFITPLSFIPLQTVSSIKTRKKPMFLRFFEIFSKTSTLNKIKNCTSGAAFTYIFFTGAWKRGFSMSPGLNCMVMR